MCTRVNNNYLAVMSIIMLVCCYCPIGAINHQTAHHLFPGIIQSHYQKITPIIKQACEEFGIKYNHVDTAWEAVSRHLQHLRRLGQLICRESDKKK